MTKLAKPVRRVTLKEYGYGRHRRRYVITLQPAGNGDMITIKPLGLRTGAFTMTVDSIYQWMVRSHVGRLQLERARAAKERKAIRLSRQREARAEARLIRP